MPQEIHTWNDYRATVREFDAVLEHGKAVAAGLGEPSPSEPHVGYGEQIFVKLLSHCIALRRLTQGPPGDLLDLPSMCALSRCVIDAHDAFEYIAGHRVTASERGFRIRLWELHDATRRLKILGGMASADPAAATVFADAARLQLALEAHDYLASLPALAQAELRLQLRRSDPPCFHLSRRQRCELSGVNADWHKAVRLQLDQHLLTLPFSVQQFRPGTPEGLRLLALPLVFALPFLSRAIQAMDLLLPGRVSKPPSRTARTMAWWRSVAEAGAQGGESGAAPPPQDPRASATTE